jgi:hypothetical protein
MDRLMWTIAESGDPKAAAEFEQRFPSLRIELLQRISMLSGLKGARAVHVPEMLRPAFRPASKRFSSNRRRGIAVAALAGFAALAAASYVYVIKRQTVPQEPAPIHVYSPFADIDHANEAGSHYRRLPQSNKEVIKPDGSPIATKPPITRSKSEIDNHFPLYGTEPPIGASKDAAGTPIKKVMMSRVGLTDALKAIGVQCQLEVQFAPQMPNPTVDVDYADTTGIEILQDLGKKYGFSVVSEGKSKVLLLPNVVRAASE